MKRTIVKACVGTYALGLVIGGVAGAWLDDPSPRVEVIHRDHVVEAEIGCQEDEVYAVVPGSLQGVDRACVNTEEFVAREVARRAPTTTSYPTDHVECDDFLEEDEVICVDGRTGEVIDQGTQDS